MRGLQEFLYRRRRLHPRRPARLLASLALGGRRARPRAPRRSRARRHPSLPATSRAARARSARSPSRGCAAAPWRADRHWSAPACGLFALPPRIASDPGRAGATSSRSRRAAARRPAARRAARRLRPRRMPSPVPARRHHRASPPAPSPPTRSPPAPSPPASPAAIIGRLGPLAGACGATTSPSPRALAAGPSYVEKSAASTWSFFALCLCLCAWHACI